MILIENFLKKEQLQNLTPEVVSSINEALNAEIDKRAAALDADMKKKFDVMVEGLSDRFNNYVNKVIVESVSSTTGDKINKKMFEVIQSMVALLESSGIPVTEQTLEAKEKLRLADEKLKTAYQEREQIKKDLDNTQKENFIYNRLQGVRPEVVSAALEHFKNKDILEVQEEIDSFLNDDLSNLVPGNDDTFTGGGEFDLDKVKDALDEIKSNDDKVDFAKVVHSGAKFENADFDKLGKGLKKPKIAGLNRMPNITEEALENSEAIVESDSGEENQEPIEDDTRDAMSKINDFGNLGYGFNHGKKTKN